MSTYASTNHELDRSNCCGTNKRSVLIEDLPLEQVINDKSDLFWARCPKQIYIYITFFFWFGLLFSIKKNCQPTVLPVPELFKSMAPHV
jgi:hypothetical protein